MEDNGRNKEIQASLEKLLTEIQKEEMSADQLDDCFWKTLKLCQSMPFYTVKNLEYTYTIKGKEMFVDRKNKSITMSTALLAFHTALELQRSGSPVTGPKKLGTFGASYLYPVFRSLGIIKN